MEVEAHHPRSAPHRTYQALRPVRTACIGLLAVVLSSLGTTVFGQQTPISPQEAALIQKLKAQKAEEEGVVRSRRLRSGVPLGGIGTGSFQLMTDGTISQLAINNNWNRPIGEAGGNFAAIWSNVGGKSRASLLSLKNRFGLPSIGAIEFRGLFPQAFVDYPDPSLPFKLSLRAFSPLIPGDLPNSSLPVAIFVFTVRNDSRVPVDLSIAFSWENLLGAGGSATRGAFDDRSGNLVTPVTPLQETVGLLMTSAPQPLVLPDDRLPYNARGSYALLGQITGPDTTATVAGWNALESKPQWWDQFAKEGTVSGSVGQGTSQKVHPAGVVALKVSLKPRETRELPFAVSWYAPRHFTLGGVNYGHFYATRNRDALEVARNVMASRQNDAALTEEWQRRLLRSNLPLPLVRGLINDAGSLVMNSVLTQDAGTGAKDAKSLFGLLAVVGPDSQPTFGTLSRRSSYGALLNAWYPALDRQELRHFASLQTLSGELPDTLGDVDRAISSPESPTSPQDVRASFGRASQFCFGVYRYFLSTGDQRILDELYPTCKRALALAGGLGQSDPPSSASEMLIWLAGLKAGERLAVRIGDPRFAEQCQEWFKAAQANGTSRFWRESDVSLDTELEGQAIADALGLGDLIPAELLARRVALAARALPKQSENALVDTIARATALVGRGQVDAALGLVRAVQSALTESLGFRWQSPPDIRGVEGRVAPPKNSLFGLASWNFYEAMCGVSMDIASARLALRPKLSTGQKSLRAPIFAATHWAWIDYRPGAAKTALTFRIDRMIPPPSEGRATNRTITQLQTGSSLTVKEIVLPAMPEGDPRVTVTLGRTPVPGRMIRDAMGRSVFVLQSPVQISPGQRLEIGLPGSGGG